MHRKAQDYPDDCKVGYNFVSRMGGIALETLRRALNEKQLTELWLYFQDRYHATVLPVPNLSPDQGT